MGDMEYAKTEFNRNYQARLLAQSELNRQISRGATPAIGLRGRLFYNAGETLISLGNWLINRANLPAEQAFMPEPVKG